MLYDLAKLPISTLLKPVADASCGFYFPISIEAISGNPALGFQACGFNREQGRGVYPGDITIDEPVIYHRGSGHSAFSQPANSVGEIRFFSPFSNRIA